MPDNTSSLDGEVEPRRGDAVGEATHHNGLAETLLSFEDLRASCRIPGTPGYRPAHDQSIACLAGELLLAFSEPRGAFAGGDNGVILVGVDAVSYEVSAEALDPPTLIPLTTIFPTTSAAAWVSLNTGMTPAQHGVVGVAYTVNGLLYRTDEDIYVEFDASAASATGARVETREGWTDLAWLPASPRIRIDGWPTVFMALAAQGVRSEAVIGDLVTMGTRKNRAIVRGATVRGDVRHDWRSLRRSPRAMMAKTIADVSDVVTRGGDRRFIWSFCNLDDYVHGHGPDREVRQALEELGEACSRWADAGWTVGVVSDHGAVPALHQPSVIERWSELSGPGFCRLPPGGAGRVRWCYPRAGLDETLREQLIDGFGGNALVVEREWLFRSGLFERTAAAVAGVGELVLLATGASFPGPVPSNQYEHGSFTWDEVAVPLAVWRN